MINIYNVLGQKVFEKQDFIKEEYKIDVSQFQKGTYFMTISDNNEIIKKTILIK